MRSALRGAWLATACLVVVVNLSGTSQAAENNLAYADLSGWERDAHGQTLAVFQRSCHVLITREASPQNQTLNDICHEALSLGETINDAVARSFFERRFFLEAVTDGTKQSGLFTGYFEPQIAASPTRTARYAVPLRAAPAGLISLSDKTRPKDFDAGFTHALQQNESLRALPDRLAIEAGALDELAPAIAWLRSPVDAFFLHIQGSGQLVYPDGTVHRVSYAGKNGHPYTSIGKVLVEREEMARGEVTMQSLRAWLETDLERGAKLMAENRSYIFFRATGETNPELGPIGQQGVPLTAGRSLAVDLSHHAAGSLLWLDTRVPSLQGEVHDVFSRLMVAQDTGSAIRGRIRGDIFFGSGEDAGNRAGRMQARGRLVALVPRP